MTLPQRGHTIGWLGGIPALGIFLPVLTLAGFSPAPPGRAGRGQPFKMTRHGRDGSGHRHLAG
jgi:hypothetical protein